MKQVDTKSQKYFAVSRAILEIIDLDGAKGLTHSEISRHSKVSRAWIYEYMGREKEDLIDVAAEVFGSFFARANTKIIVNTPEELKKLLQDGQDITFKNVKEEPVIIKLYYRYRGTATPIGSVIKKYEKHWLDYMTSNFIRILSLDQKTAFTISATILTLRLGFSHRIATSTAPAKELQEAREALDLLHGQIF
jgi:hypothetical protein